jgi:hypothetical protein
MKNKEYIIIQNTNGVFMTCIVVGLAKAFVNGDNMYKYKLPAHIDYMNISVHKHYIDNPCISIHVLLFYRLWTRSALKKTLHGFDHVKSVVMNRSQREKQCGTFIYAPPPPPPPKKVSKKICSKSRLLIFLSVG